HAGERVLPGFELPASLGALLVHALDERRQRRREGAQIPHRHLLAIERVVVALGVRVDRDRDGDGVRRLVEGGDEAAGVHPRGRGPRCFPYDTGSDRSALIIPFESTLKAESLRWHNNLLVRV